MGRRPAVLKVYRGAHEVISTIMMNYVANGVLLYLLSGALKDPGQRGAIAQQQTPQVETTAQVGSMVPLSTPSASTSAARRRSPGSSSWPWWAPWSTP
jgi:ABC-type uncharacterized transport system permease subunit